MNEGKRSLLKVLSILLQYPNENFPRHLEELSEAVAEISEPEAQEKCVKFLSYIEDTPFIRLQEEYTATFDLNPSTCLNLSYHKWGDARERGNALLGFQRLYHSNGYESKTGELPDYLPLVLEFLSISGLKNRFSFLGDYRDQVEGIGSNLIESGSPYAALFKIVVDIFRELGANGV